MQIIGNKRAKKYLLDNYQHSYTWIFYGIKGIGKHSIALNFSKWLLNSKDILQNPDFFYAENSKIDTVRELKTFLTSHSFNNFYKIAILDNFCDSNTNTFNALLKITEENIHDKILIFLIAHNLYKVPLALRSRCKQLYFTPILPQDLPNKLYEKNKLLFHLSNNSIGTFLHLIKHKSFYNEILNHFFFKKDSQYYFSEENFKLTVDVILKIILEVVKNKLLQQNTHKEFLKIHNITKSVTYWHKSFNLIQEIYKNTLSENLNKKLSLEIIKMYL